MSLDRNGLMQLRGQQSTDVLPSVAKEGRADRMSGFAIVNLKEIEDSAGNARQG
jgi:hypothetical protein